ncbi:transmembrane protein 205 [Opisthocomus hoazin]|uniref:transmembrane protein 205 n=1 Tax=Opisthocomus hoazin TaxID=30419 RepID=UPI003F5375F5
MHRAGASSASQKRQEAFGKETLKIPGDLGASTPGGSGAPPPVHDEAPCEAKPRLPGPARRRQQRQLGADSGGSVTDMEGPIPGQDTTPTNAEPSNAIKLLHLVFLSTSWGMQVWVTFVAGFVMSSRLPRHTFGFIQRELFPYYFHIGSACAFLNLTLFAMHHPSELLSDEEATQIIVLFVCVAASVLNTQWFGKVTADLVADVHLIEHRHGLGQEVGVSSSSSRRQLRASDPSYGRLSRQFALYHALSSLCNLCCIACNGFTLYRLAARLRAL